MEKSKIYITGDTHRNIDIKKTNTKNFPEQKELTKNDYVIIVGDFGLPWVSDNDPTDKWWLDWFNNKSFTTLFIDGNHENFDVLYKYPEVDLLGAKCHKLRDSVYHIKRGEIICVNNTNILCMGGGVSIDKAYRKEGVSWWKEEEPSYDEWEKAFLNIENADVVLTHDGPYSVLKEMGLNIRGDNVNKTLDRLFQREIKVKKWFFGHHHVDKSIKYKGIEFYCLYDNIEIL